MSDPEIAGARADQRRAATRRRMAVAAAASGTSDNRLPPCPRGLRFLELVFGGLELELRALAAVSIRAMNSASLGISSASSGPASPLRRYSVRAARLRLIYPGVEREDVVPAISSWNTLASRGVARRQRSQLARHARLDVRHLCSLETKLPCTTGTLYG